jgi:drug/metabolite transporter (DMT)-like permease
VADVGFGIAMVLIAVLTWAFASIGYKLALGTKGSVERDPITSLAFRNTVVAIFLLILIPFIGNISAVFTLSSDLAIQYWIYASLAGLTDLLGHACYFNALRHLDSSRVYPFLNFQMLMTYPIAIFLLGEAVPRFLWLAALLIIIGVMFVGSPDNKDRGFDKLNVEERRSHTLKGIIFGISTGAFFALFYLSMAMENRVFQGEFESNFTRMVISVIMIWFFLLIRPQHLPKLRTLEDKAKIKSYLLTGAFACLSAGIGDAVYQMGVRENGASVSITIASTAPLFNQLLAILILKEKFRPRFLIGVMFIVIGNILVIF